VTVFEDSSAIVTRYTPEPGRQRMDHDAPVVISDLSRVEVSSAIWRKHHIGDLSPSQARVLINALLADMGAADEPATPSTTTYLPVAVSPEILDRGVGLCGTHGLRAYDAVQLASAIQARTADSGVSDFVTYDVALHRAAAAEGFRVNPLR
jgi:uncharacterized protein